MSFGRKGLDAASAAGNGLDVLRNANAGTAPGRTFAGDEIERKREAFIASERARKVERGEPGLSAAAYDYAGSKARPERSLFMAYLLWFILGQVSAHRFYLGATQSACVQVELYVFGLATILAGITGEGPATTAGPLAFLGIGCLAIWALWILGDVFFIGRIHREHCRRPGEAASVFA